MMYKGAVLAWFLLMCVLFLPSAARALKASLTDGLIQDISEVGGEGNY